MDRGNIDNIIHWAGFFGICIVLLILMSMFSSCVNKQQNRIFQLQCVEKHGQIKDNACVSKE